MRYFHQCQCGRKPIRTRPNGCGNPQHDSARRWTGSVANTYRYL